MFMVIPYLAPSFSLFSNMERSHKSFHTLPEGYVSHFYVPKQNCIQLFNLFFFLSFIHSVYGSDIWYIPFLCYSNTSKLMVNFFLKISSFLAQERLATVTFFSYISSNSVSFWQMKKVCYYIGFPLMYCLNVEWQLMQLVLKNTAVKHCFLFIYICKRTCLYHFQPNLDWKRKSESN